MANIHYVRIDFTNANSFRKLSSPDQSVLYRQNSYYQHYFYTWFNKSSPLHSFVCGIDNAPPTYRIDHRVVNESFIVFITEGKGTLNGVPFEAGQLFVLEPNRPTTMVSDSEKPWKLCWISWRGELSEYFGQVFGSFTPEKIYSAPDPYRIQSIFASIVYADHSHADISGMVLSFSELLASLIAENVTLANAVNDSVGLSRRNVKYVEQAKRILAEQYATVSIARLSNMLYLNRKYFCQIFHNIVGITPQQYLIDLRLQNSIFHLENSNMTLKNVAETCGYSSYTGYVNAFKRKYGVTPNEYRKRFNK